MCYDVLTGSFSDNSLAPGIYSITHDPVMISLIV